MKLLDLLKNKSLQQKQNFIFLSLVTIVLLLIIILISVLYNEIKRSDDLLLATKVNSYILKANGYQTIERGATTTVLSNPYDTDTYNRIKTLRNYGDSYLDSALVLAKEMLHKSIFFEKKYNEILNIKNERDRVRTEADNYLSKTQAEQNFITKWFQIQTKLIMYSNSFGQLLSTSEDPLEKILYYNTVIQKAVFYASEFSGRERAIIGFNIGRGTPIDSLSMKNLVKFRSIVDENIKVMQDFKDNPFCTDEIKYSIESMEKIFLQEFEKTRVKVYYESANNLQYSLASDDWFDISTKAINSILDVNKAMNNEVVRINQELKVKNYIELGVILIVILLVVGILYLSRRISIELIVNPIKRIAEAANKVSLGNYNVKVEYSSQDEIGNLANDFNIMVQRIYITNEKLKEEKASVERRVEEAVRDIEQQRVYLKESVDKILSAMQKFASGDLTIQLDVKGDDEINRLFDGFNKTVQNMKKLLLDVNKAIDTLVNVSTQLSATSEEISAGSYEQTNQINEITASITEISNTIEDTAKNISNAAISSRNAGDIAKEGGKVINSTIDGMNNIANVVEKSAEIIKELGNSSAQIGEIIQVIDEIADQTNLLALNAAIEAARAGEQGRGFAVVADEVRKLAERTSKATKEIADMIKKIQNDTKQAVQSMISGTEEAEKGKQLANRAGNTLEEIIQKSQISVDMITQVAAASEELSSSSQQVLSNVNIINKSANENLQAIQEVNKAAENLNKLAINLQVMLERFKT